MFIVQLYSGQSTTSGDFVYRIEQPGKGLSSVEGVQAANLDLLDLPDISVLTKVPVLILHHLSDPDLLPVVAERRRRGLLTIYELADNFRFSGEHLPQAKRRGPPEYHVVMEELLRRCHAVQTTGPALRDRYQNLNRNFLIFPNLVDAVHRGRREASISKKVTIGWGGSARHFSDLAHYADALCAWILRNPETRLAIMATEKIQRLFSNLPRSQVALYRPGKLTDYFSFLDALDIGVAPLLPTEFNACRSDVKYLEYALRQVVPLCSRFGPYTEIGREGENILLFGEAAELTEQLDRLHSNPQLGRRIALQAKQWVERNRLNRRQVWEQRVKTYRKLFNQVHKGQRIESARVGEFSNARAGTLLRRALNASNPKTAYVLLKRAVAAFPSNYQVHYFFGWASYGLGQTREAIAALERACQLCPTSIRSLQLLTRMLITLKDFNSALHMAERALELEPELPTLLTLKAISLQLQNRHQEAKETLEPCLRKAPKLVEAEIAYARSAIELHKFQDVRRSLNRLLRLAPESPVTASLRLLVSKRESRTVDPLRHLNAY